MKYDVDLCMKVSEKRWIKSLRNGTICFNPIAYFIQKAENTGNNEQGDKYEGVFGRLKKTDIRLNGLVKTLGDNLEIIDDGDYAILRRKSVRSIPIFCTYGILRNELVIDSQSVYKENGEYYCTVRYDFPNKIYNGFLDVDDVWGFYCSAGYFHQKIDRALNHEKIQFRKAIINYDIDLSQEFLLPLDDDYSEVTHKRIELSYQHEIRYWLLNFPQEEKYLLKYDTLSGKCCGIAPKELYLIMKCKCDLTEE